MGLPGPHRCPRIHPADRAGPLHRRLPGEPGVQRVSGDPRPRLRSAVRARLPPRPHRAEAGRHLPPEARGGRSPRRRHRPAAEDPQGQERQAHRLHRRRLRLADGGQRSHAARLRGDHLRAVRRARRPDAHQHSLVPPAADGAERRDRHDHRHGRRPAPQLAGAQHARAARRRGSTPCSSAPARPRARSSKLPGRETAAANVHIGIAWLESVAFGHIDKIGERVLIIGVGNTAMDCCRTSLRLGAESVKVMARKPRGFFKASVWELEDAEEESVEIVINRSPKALRHRERPPDRHDVRQDGVRARRHRPHHRRAHRGRGVPAGRRRDPRHRPGERLPLDRARPGHRVRQVGRAGHRQAHLPVDAARGVLRWRRRLRTEEHHLGGRARPPGRHLHPPSLPGRDGERAAGAGHQPAEPQDGHARVELRQRLHRGGAAADAARLAQGALQEAQHRGRARLHRRAGGAGSAALPQLRRADGVQRQAVHRVRRLHRHLPGRLPHHHPQRRRVGAAHAPEGAGART